MRRGTWHPGGHNGQASHHGGRPGQGSHQGGPGPHPTIRPPPPLAPPNHHSSSYYTQPQHRTDQSFSNHAREPTSKRNQERGHREAYWDDHRERSRERGVYQGGGEYSDIRRRPDNGGRSARLGYPPERELSGDSSRGRENERTGHFGQGRNMNQMGNFESGRYENTIHPNQPFDGYAWESTDYDYEVDARHHGITGATHKEVRVSTSHSFQEPTRPARSEPSSSSLSLPPPVYGIGHPPPGYLPTGGPPPSVPLRSNTPLEPPRFNPSHELHAPNSDPGPSSLGPASTSPVPSLAPPPAPHIGSLTPESQPKAGSRDPRRRLRDGERESERPTVSASGGLGIRSDIYENQAPHAAENRADASYHQPEPPVSQPEEQEVKFSDTDAFSKLPDSTVVDVEEDTKDTKEAKTVVSTNYRCTFCPSPGLVPLTEKISHQALHASSCFSCAACGGRRTFPEFEQLVLHIHSLHLVTDSEMVRETILLPESGPGALRVFRCGVTNCGVTFTAQSEVVLRAHMEAVHGSYYVKLGKGKYLLRFCRICGEERCFSSEKELLTHILTSHPPDQFGQRLSDGEEEAVAEVKQEVVEAVEDSTLVNSQCQEGETLTSGLMEATASRPRTVETASSLSPEPSTSSVLAIEAIELATQSTSAGHSSKEEKKRKRKRKNLKMESSGQESSESSSDSEEEHVGKKKKKKSKKEGKEKSKKKIPIEVKKKKFKDQVGKMTPEEIKEHILKMKEKADKLLKKKSVKEKVEVMKKKSVLSNPPDPKDPWPKIFKDKTAHYFCLFCNIYAGKLEKWLLHRAHVDHITAYCSTKEAALQRLDCDEIELQECVIGEEKFEQAPLGQCKECFQVFWSSADPESHLKDGRCLRTAQKHQASNASEKERSRSASPPFIKWKPLRKPTEKSLEQGEIEERSKKEELKANERLVSYRSPSHRKPSLSPPRPVSTPSGGPSHVVSQSGARYKRYGSISPPRRTPSPPKPVPPPNDGRGQVVSVTGAKYKRYGSISPPPRSPRPRSRTKSPPSGYSQRKMRRRSPSYPKRSRSKSSSRGRSSRSHGRKSRSQRRWSRSPGRRSRSPWSPPRRSRSPRSPLRRSRSPRWRSRSPTRRSRSPASRRRRRSSGGGGSPTYSPYRRPSTPPIPRSPRSSSPQVVGYRQSGWSRTSSHARSSRRWRSPTPPPRPEPVLTQEEREERLEEESRLLERLRNEKSKELSTTDLREKLESKKCVMLDSRGEVTVEGGKEEKRVCPICSNKFNDDSLLLQHMKMEHRRDMFGCSKCSRDKQPAIGWSIEVLVQHLASTHELDVSISEAISGFLAIPESLHKVTCKLCPPPHILGSKGFWLAGDVSEHMVSIEEHFEQVHLMSERSHIMGKLELACRGCDFILPHTGANKVEWADHLRRNHARLNRKDSRANRAGPRKRCDFCGDQIVQTEAVRHVKEEHAKETFQCKICLAADPACFPYAETIKEMTGHMVLKHKDVESYYEHMIYPETLYGAICSGKDCAQRGKILAFNPVALGKHLREHQDLGEEESGELFCRCCDRVKERFKTPVEVELHIGKRHKQLLKWREQKTSN